MKLVLFSMVLLLVFSCSKDPVRGIASVDSLPRNVYVPGDIKTSLQPPEVFRKYHGPVWVLLDGGQDLDELLREYPDVTLAELGMDSIPDARGKFLRMANNGATGDSFDPDGDRALGSFQGDAIRNITGQIGSLGQEFNSSSASGAYGKFRANNNFGSGHKKGSPALGWNFDASRVVPTAGDNRPKNIAVNYYVKIASCPNDVETCL